MRHLIQIVESGFITGLRPRYEDVELTDEDLRRFAAKASTAEDFAFRLAEPETPAYQQLLQFWLDCEKENFPVKQETKFVIPYAGQLIADKLGATGYKSLPRGGSLPWDHSEFMGGSGYIITTPEGRVFLDATLEDHTIFMAQISVEDRASGLGTKVMNAIHDIAQEQGWKVTIYKVSNQKFFQKFPWLTQKSQSTFEG